MTNEEERKLLRALLDKEAIRQMLFDLAAAVDRVDEDEIARHYTADAYDDHGPFAGTGEEFAHRPGRRLPANMAASHLLCQSSIDLQGDEAFVETYFYAPMVWDVDGQPTEIFAIGRYHDRVVRTDDGWKVAFRRVVMDSGSERPWRKWPDADLYQRGSRYPDDLRYHRDRWNDTLGV